MYISEEAKQVLRLLSTANYHPRKIANHLKKSRQTIYKHIRTLKKNNLIDENREPIGGAYNLLSYQQGTKDQYRINDLRVFFELPVSIKKEHKDKWKKDRKRMLVLKKVSFRPLDLKNKQGVITDAYPEFWIDKFRCRAHANGIAVIFPDIYDKDKVNADNQANKLIEWVGLELNRIFKPIEFFKFNSVCFRISGYELAHLDDAEAKGHRKQERKYFISLDGQLRYQFDFSHAIDEGEAMTFEYAHQDQNNMQTHYQDILKEGKNLLVPSQIRELFEKQAIINAERHEAERLRNASETIFAKNIAEHTRLVSEVADIAKASKEGIEWQNKLAERQTELLERLDKALTNMKSRNKALKRLDESG